MVEDKATFHGTKNKMFECESRGGVVVMFVHCLFDRNSRFLNFLNQRILELLAGRLAGSLTLL